MSEENPNFPVKRKSVWGYIGCLLMAIVAMTVSSCSRRGWNEATRESAGLAPVPENYEEAVVMVFRARTWGVRGIVADHTWISTKAKSADVYTVYEVIGWRNSESQPVLRIREDIPDRHWFGAKPIVVLDIRGKQARELVDKIAAAALEYPHKYQYRIFPGPNSNTFTAWIGERVPELNLRLPMRAIGKNYR